MPDDGYKKSGSETVSQTENQVERTERERRAAERFPFIVTAEAEEMDSGARLPARTSDLSLTGCFLDTLNPFPAGTRTRIRLTQREQTFDALGVVAYAQMGMGMGVAFTQLNANAAQMLQQWLAELGCKDELPKNLIQTDSPGAPKASADAGVNMRFDELIGLLQRKGVLTVEEAQELLG